MRKWIAGILLAALAAGAVGTEAVLASGRETTLDIAYGHVFHTDSDDRVALYGERQFEGRPYYKNIRIEVYGASGTLLAAVHPASDAGFQPRINLLDFSGDGLVQIFLSIESGGSGAFGYYYAYGASGGTLATLFDYEAFSAANVYDGKLVDDYRAELVNTNTREVFRIDISGRPQDYLDGLYDTHGKLKAPVTVDVSGTNTVAPYYNAADGLYQLLVYQRVTGLYSADAYGYMLTQQRLGGGAFETFFTLAGVYGFYE